MTIPNIISLFRLAMVPLFIWLSVERMYAAALVLFVTAALTDVLDGIAARRLNQRSRLGALLDPAADKFLMVSGYLFYTFSPALPVVRIPGWLTFTVFIRDLLLVSFAYLLYTRVHMKRFPPSWAGKTSTVLQAVTLGTVIGVNAFVPRLLWLAELLFRGVLLITLFSAFDYLRRADRRLLESGRPARA